MKSFGERLKELRLEKGWSQKELGIKIGRSQSSINYWENDKQEPTLSAIVALCKLFNVSADYLLGLTD